MSDLKLCLWATGTGQCLFKGLCEIPVDIYDGEISVYRDGRERERGHVHTQALDYQELQDLGAQS